MHKIEQVRCGDVCKVDITRTTTMLQNHFRLTKMHETSVILDALKMIQYRVLSCSVPAFNASTTSHP